MRILRILLLAVAFCGLGSLAGAQAQTREADPCVSDAASEGFGAATTGCLRQLIGRQLLVNSISTIPRIVAQSLGIGPDEVEPAGLGNLTPAEYQDRLAGGSSIIISPVSDSAAVAVPQPQWNAWIDGKYTWNDASPGNLDLDGPLFNGLAGIDYKINSRFTVGLMGSYESSNLDGILTDLRSRGWGGGPYLGLILTDNIVFSASLIGSRIDSSQAGGFFDFESKRLQAAASLNGYWYKDTWRFTPGLSLSWSKEWIEETSGFFLPDQTLETAMLTPTVQIGNTLRLSDTSTVEPWAGAALDFVFVNETKTSGVGSVDDPYADLRLQAGFNFNFGTNAQLAIIGELGGLIQDSVDTYAGEISFAMQF